MKRLFFRLADWFKPNLRSPRRRRSCYPRTEKLEERRLLTGTITGRVWFDTNANGQQDAAETQTSNVTVQRMLSGNVVQSATAVNGIFTFTNVPTDQSFHYQFNLPTGYTIGPQDLGADATDNDWDVYSTDGATVAHRDFVSVADGQTVVIDAGLALGSTLTTFCWNDIDGDGIQDAGAEANGIGSVDVSLRSTGVEGYAGAGKTSGANGIVTFNNVRPGTFNLVFTHPTFARTLQDQGGNDALDSDANPANGNTANFTLTPGGTRTDVDAGFRDPAVVTGSITGLAWLDNGDGVRQNNETALTGLQNFDLYRSADGTVGNADDQFVDGVATDANHVYTFTGLGAGNYYVKSIVPENYAITLLNQGVSDLIDSDFDQTTRNTGMLTVTAGTTISNVDVGFIPGSATIGNFVWNDVDRDGMQDAGETGLAGATVKLFNSANVLIGTPITTTGTGLYSFSGLQAGQYYITVTAPVGYLISPRDQGSDTTDSDADPTTGKSVTFTLAAGASQLQWDFGMHLGARVGDKVWLDTNQNGIQDAGEPGKQGVGVKLKTVGADGNAGTADDVVVAQTSTDATGKYEFAAVRNGSYYVEFAKLAGFAFTKRDIGSDLTDSDAGLTNGRTAIFTIANYANNFTIDAGLIPTGNVTVHISPDTNDDGVLNPGGFIPGIEVLVFNPVNDIPGDNDDVFIVRGVTNPQGDIVFPNLPPGPYYIRILLPPGHRFALPNRGGTESSDSDVIFVCSGYGNTGTFQLGSSSTTAITVGLVPLTGAIEGVAWVDANRNKIRDGALIQGTVPDIVLAIDISGSTSEIYAGATVGDVNGDGLANTILDAEVLAGISLVNQLNSAGYGATSRISIVTFNHLATQLDMNSVQAGVQVFARPNANVDADATLDVIEVLTALRSSGATNYEAALQQVVNTFNALATPVRQGTLLFFSDGPPSLGGSIGNSITMLQSMGISRRAFGLGPAASLSILQSIDPKAQVYQTTDDFFQVMQLNNSVGFASERGFAGITVYLDRDNDGILDGNELRVSTLADDPDTDIDETGTFRFTNIGAGTYAVRTLFPAGYTQTWPGSPGFGWSATVSVGRTTRNADFGFAANPTLTGVPASASYKAGATRTTLAPSAVVFDADNPALTGGSLSIQVKTNSQSTDIVSIFHQGNGTGQIGVSGSTVFFGGVAFGSFTGGNGSTALVITFNYKATLAIVQALARRITFHSTSATPSTLQRSIEWKLTDKAGGGTAVVAQAVNVSLSLSGFGQSPGGGASLPGVKGKNWFFDFG